MSQEDIEDPGAVRCAGCGQLVHPESVVPVTVEVLAGVDDNVGPGLAATRYTCGAECCRASVEARIRGGRPEPTHEDGASAVAEFDRKFPSA